MATYKATIVRGAKSVSLKFHVHGKELDIVLTEDNPNKVKNVFNNLLAELMKGIISFQLEDEGDDLYAEIGKEYIGQLNAELLIIYEELKETKLLEESGDIEEEPEF